MTFLDLNRCQGKRIWKELFYLKKFFKVDTCFEYTGLTNEKKKQ